MTAIKLMPWLLMEAEMSERIGAQRYERSETRLESIMEPFICPRCGRQSTFNPWVESAKCPECGYSPAEQASARRKVARERLTHPPLSRWQLLEELVSHWNGTYVPDGSLELLTVADKLRFFQAYRWALGERPSARPGRHEAYARAYHPRDEEALRFVEAYLSLRRGDIDAAARRFQLLTRSSPRFTDPWIWLSATARDHEERVAHLSQAAALELTHPLARDGLAVIRGRVSLEEVLAEGEEPLPVEVVRCPQCGGTWHHTPGASEVVCAYCGHAVPLEATNALGQRATLMSDLRLRRRESGRAWTEAVDAVRCASCGAQVIMAGHLSRQCAFCGSAQVVAFPTGSGYVQPEGVLPFDIDEQQAQSAVRQAWQSGLRGVAAWLRGGEQERVEVKGVYVPFYSFSGFVDVRTSPSTGLIMSMPASDEVRTDAMMFSGILLPAVTVPSAGLLERVLPFDLTSLVPYDARLLAGWPAALYTRDVEEVVEDAYERIMALARHRIGVMRALEGWGEADDSPVPRPWRVTSCTYQLVLLPLWIGVVHQRGERNPALVNGQTGEVVFRSILSGL